MISIKIKTYSLVSVICLIVCIFCFQNSNAQRKLFNKKKKQNSSIKTQAIVNQLLPIDSAKIKLVQKTNWVDSIYSQMSLDEKIGQLFMVAAYSKKDSVHFNAIDKLIRDYKIGGLIFFQGGPVKQAKLTNRFQAKSKIPLFIGIDAEWGLSMRLDSTARYPWNMTLGAIQDKALIEKLGEQLGYQTKRMGMQFNFSPVIDINTNPKNPIIGFRSFGENKYKVTEDASALIKGMKKGGIFATGKHFPGHGDSASDSHHTLPVINFSKERLDDVELYPYKKLFQEGLSSVMVAHLDVPSLDARPGYPSSISYNIVTNLLQKELGFKGLIFTDALNMKGASNFSKPGDIDLEAFMAGNDILLFPENVPVASEKICMAIQDSTLTEDRLAQSVKKILSYKFEANLNHYKPIVIDNLYNDLNKSENEALQYKLFENSATVLRNNDEILPIINPENERIAYVSIGEDESGMFLSTMKKYTNVTEVKDSNIDSLNVKLQDYSMVIVGYHKPDKAWRTQEITRKEIEWIDKISINNKKMILSCFAKPYLFSELNSVSGINAMIMTYQNGPIPQTVAAEILFGALDAKGKLPVSITPYFNENDGILTKKTNILGFDSPLNQNMNPDILNKIDKVVAKAIDKKMTPGAQVLVARNGKIIFQKNYGYQEYNTNKKITDSDIYDVASLTKVVATLPLVIQDFDAKKINLETQLQTILPEFANTDKATINLKDLLSHQARLQAWVPFYKATLDENNKPLAKYYRKVADNEFSIKVADSLFMRNDYKDSIFSQIVHSKLIPKKEYKYSDFTFMILKEYLEKSHHESLDVLAENNFFKPLAMTNTTYNPLQKTGRYFIVSTEEDIYFRHQKIQGYVHDMGAAMQGGVGGHAGIFSNATDIAKIMQLYLQNGVYGGKQYFSQETFDEFNTCYFCGDGNRRGLGFDKPQLGTSGPTCGCVSKSSFGHTGFTGTMVWADPETQIVYVFLSNRTFPDSNLPNTLSRENIREDIQKIIQDAIIK